MRALLKEMGKQPVVVKDIRGFIINRIQFALLREALYIVESGAASFEDVDMVLKAGMGLRYAVLGPFGVADFGGLDVFDHINQYLNADLCDAKTGDKLLLEIGRTRSAWSEVRRWVLRLQQQQSGAGDSQPGSDVH